MKNLISSIIKAFRFSRTQPTKQENDIHHYVDLGLSVKWATCNVGASRPEEYGDHIAWGETRPKSEYNWITYRLCNGLIDTLIKYNTFSVRGTVDNKTTLDLADDAAHINWGGSWRTPTVEEFEELRTKCTWKWTNKGNVNGYSVTGPNGNSIFLPASGHSFERKLYFTSGTSGYYWSSSISPFDSAFARGIEIYWLKSIWLIELRCDGFSVRPVCP